ncbi:MAG: dicarboxylate/amino acid:cation symporter, partial [Planctomycetota bacterium]
MRLKVHTQILIAIVLGALVGLVLGEKAGHLKIVGDMFIKLLKMIIIPLILASMVAGIVSLGDARRLGRIGLKTFVYYMATTLLAVGVGLVLVNLIRPGVGVDMGAGAAVDMTGRETPSLGSII